MVGGFIHPYFVFFSHSICVSIASDHSCRSLGRVSEDVVQFSTLTEVIATLSPLDVCHADALAFSIICSDVSVLPNAADTVKPLAVMDSSFSSEMFVASPL